jgi:hypothetical protein
MSCFVYRELYCAALALGLLPVGESNSGEGGGAERRAQWRWQRVYDVQGGDRLAPTVMATSHNRC